MFDVSFLALLLVCFGMNATDHPLSQDSAKLYNFLFKDPSGKAAVVFYATKNVSVVEQLPGYIKGSKVVNNCLVKTSDVDRALFHGAQDLILTHDVKKASTSSAVSLVISALWNTADRFGLSKYIQTESDLLNALAYGFAHSACLFVAEEQIKKLS